MLLHQSYQLSVPSFYLLVFKYYTSFSLCAAMKRLLDKGAPYFVMDLRDNLGGLVQVHSTIVT